MDLAAARSADPELAGAERRRFLAALRPLLAQPGPKLLVRPCAGPRRWPPLRCAVWACACPVSCAG
jgi:hypothetical protein